MAYGTNKRTRSTIQRVVTSVDKSTGKKTVKKYPAKEMKSKSITEKEFNSNGKTKAAPAPKKASPSKKKDSKTLDMITKAPGYVVTYPLKKTLDIGIAAGNKLKQMKSDYETGKKMRERQEFKDKGGKSIKQKISESVKTYNKMQSSKKKSK